MSAVSISVTPSSSAASMTARDCSRSQRAPKLLVPRPTTETSGPPSPSDRVRTARRYPLGSVRGGFGGRSLVVGARWSSRGKDAGSPDSSTIGATEDAASRRPARPGGTRLIVKRALRGSVLELVALVHERGERGLQDVVQPGGGERPRHQAAGAGRQHL